MFVEHLLTGTDEEARRRFGPDADKLRATAIAYMRGDIPPAAPEDEPAKVDERGQLRAELERRGGKVDARWGVERLRKELEDA